MRKKEREDRLLGTKKGKTVFLSKKSWEDFLEDREKNLKTFTEGELHYYFGDYPEKDVVEVEMVEVPKHAVLHKRSFPKCEKSKQGFVMGSNPFEE